MKLPSKQEMVILTNSLRQAAAAANINVYSFSEYDFAFDSVLHYLEIEPRDLQDDYKSMFDDLKLYDALAELRREFWLSMHFNVTKEGDGGVCELKHVIHVDTSDSQKVIERSLDMLREYDYYSIDKVVIFPYCVM